MIDDSSILFKQRRISRYSETIICKKSQRFRFSILCYGSIYTWICVVKNKTFVYFAISYKTNVCMMMIWSASILSYFCTQKWCVFDEEKCLESLFELRHEVQVFFADHHFELTSKFHEWIQIRAYFFENVPEMNKCNLGLLRVRMPSHLYSI